MGNPNPKPPKRKKSSAASRKTRGNTNKRSKYDYAGARAALSLPSNANPQVIASTSSATPTDHTAGAARSSPLKKEYKAMLFEERNRNKALAKKFEDSEQHLQNKDRKISSLKNEVRQLSSSLRAEKEKSRITILKLIDDVEDAIAESTIVKEDTNEKMSAAELAIVREKEKSQNAIQREREYTSYAISSRKLNSYYLLIYISTELIS